MNNLSKKKNLNIIKKSKKHRQQIICTQILLVINRFQKHLIKGLKNFFKMRKISNIN